MVRTLHTYTQWLMFLTLFKYYHLINEANIQGPQP